MHIVELQRRLQEAQGIETKERIKPYTASARFQKDIENLSKIGMTSKDISYSLDVPMMFVQKQKARIAKANEARRRFLATGHIQEELETPGYFAILQK